MKNEVYNPQIDEFINEDEEDMKQQLVQEFEHTEEPGELVDDAEFDEDEERKNPFQAIAEFYQETVDEANKKGFSEIFKHETERFFEIANDYLQDNYKLSFTPTDVQYLDGYFLFGHGSNSVIQFHVKEAPGWLFGIWWSAEEAAESTKEHPTYLKTNINCEFFAQYEENIDKFKPSASTFVDKIYWSLHEDHSNVWFKGYHISHVVLLILQHPELAFYRDFNSTDLNVEYVSEEKAKSFYTEWRLKENAIQLMKQENEKAMLDCLKYIYGPVLEKGDAFINDRGEGWSPRYELILRNVWKDEGQADSQDGCFDLFDWGAEGWDDKEQDEALWDKTIAKCEARAKALDTYWYSPVSTSLVIVSGEKYWKYKKEAEEQHD